MFGRRKRAPEEGVVAEILRRLARECGGPMGEAAYDALREAVQEQGGLGYLPGFARLGSPRASLGAALFDGDSRAIDMPTFSPGPRRGSSMPFAKDFSAGAGRAQARRAEPRAARPRPAFRGGDEPWEAPPQPPPPPRAPRAPRTDPAVLRAYATIGMPVGTPIDEVRRRRREIVFESDLHEDRRGGKGDKRAEARLRQINAAVSVIDEWLRGRDRL